MDSKAFKIGADIKNITTFKVGTPTARHPVAYANNKK